MSNPNDYVISFLETRKELFEDEGCSACAASALSASIIKLNPTHVLRGKMAACQEVEETGHKSGCKRKRKI